MSVRDLLDLSGKVAVVTGGSRGIGLQMAAALGEMGARVALTARKQDELDEARAHLESTDVECLTRRGRPLAVRLDPARSSTPCSTAGARSTSWSTTPDATGLRRPRTIRTMAGAR